MKNKMEPNVHGLPVQSMGDIVDKISILTRKLFFGEEEAADELRYLEQCLDSVKGLPISGKLVSAIVRVTQANYDIWNLENELRKGGEQKFEREEIGARAIEIRNFNKRRIRYKNEINDITGLGFREFKIKHRSQ